MSEEVPKPTDSSQDNETKTERFRLLLAAVGSTAGSIVMAIAGEKWAESVPNWAVLLLFLFTLAIWLYWGWTHPKVKQHRRLIYTYPRMSLIFMVAAGTLLGGGIGSLLWLSIYSEPQSASNSTTNAKVTTSQLENADSIQTPNPTQPQITPTSKVLPEKAEHSKIEILFEPSDKYVTSSGSPSNREVFIGVKNTSSSTINNLRVEIEELKIGDKTYYNIPLRKMHDTPPYNQEFTLTPQEEMMFRVVSHLPKAEELTAFGSHSSQPIKLYLANESIPDELEFAEHKIPIAAKGDNTLPNKGILSVGTWKGGTLRVGYLEKP